MTRSVPESLLICILVLCLALTPISVRGETEDSGKAQQLIEAPGAVLMEKETGTVIYSRDPDTRRSPASITKIMTLILIFDAIREGPCVWRIALPPVLMPDPWEGLRYFWKKEKSRLQKP